MGAIQPEGTWERATGNVGGSTTPHGAAGSQLTGGEPPEVSIWGPSSLRIGVLPSLDAHVRQTWRRFPVSCFYPTRWARSNPLRNVQDRTSTSSVPFASTLWAASENLQLRLGGADARMTRYGLPDPSQGERRSIRTTGTMKESTASGSRCQSVAVRLSAREVPASPTRQANSRYTYPLIPDSNGHSATTMRLERPGSRTRSSVASSKASSHGQGLNYLQLLNVSCCALIILRQTSRRPHGETPTSSPTSPSPKNTPASSIDPIRRSCVKACGALPFPALPLVQCPPCKVKLVLFQRRFAVLLAIS